MIRICREEYKKYSYEKQQRKMLLFRNPGIT